MEISKGVNNYFEGEQEIFNTRGRQAVKWEQATMLHLAHRIAIGGKSHNQTMFFKFAPKRLCVIG